MQKSLERQMFALSMEKLKLSSNHADVVRVYYVDGDRRAYVPGGPEERRMVKKIDLHMFTCVTVLYLLNYLDRQNVGLLYSSS